jgi:hypothetical protein
MRYFLSFGGNTEEPATSNTAPESDKRTPKFAELMNVQVMASLK